MAKSKEIVRKPGRPAVYDHAVIVKILKKHQGKAGGLTQALKELQGLKGFEKISYGSLSVISKKSDIKFGLGKPKDVPEVPVKAPKKAKKASKEVNGSDTPVTIQKPQKPSKKAKKPKEETVVIQEEPVVIQKAA